MTPRDLARLFDHGRSYKCSSATTALQDAGTGDAAATRYRLAPPGTEIAESDAKGWKRAGTRRR